MRGLFRGSKRGRLGGLRGSKRLGERGQVGIQDFQNPGGQRYVKGVPGVQGGCHGGPTRGSREIICKTYKNAFI